MVTLDVGFDASGRFEWLGRKAKDHLEKEHARGVLDRQGAMVR